MPNKSKHAKSQPRAKAHKPKARTVTTTRVIRGRGDYTVSAKGPNSQTSNPGILARLAEPFLNETASVGLVNKAARYAGNALGSWTGIPGAGSALGNAASSVARILGFGDYKVQRNNLANEAIVQFKGAESTVISGREFVTNISGSSAFQSLQFIINPGNSTLFPWFSTVARNYENWEPMGIVLEFRTTSAFATGTTNSALGTVIQATDYDVIDTPYANKQQMLISTFANSQAPCTSFYHPVECASKKNPLSTYYVQTGNTAASYPDDPRFSALGNFQIATEGMQTSNVIGELWVSYRFRMSKPQLSAATQVSNFAHHKFSATVAGPTTTVFQQGMVPNMSILAPGTTAELLVITNLPPGDYMLVYNNISSDVSFPFVAPSLPIVGVGATVLDHSSSSTGTYGGTQTYNATISTAGGAVHYTAQGNIQFRMDSITSTMNVPLYTWGTAGAICHRDFWLSAIPVYAATAYSRDKFMELFMANRTAIMQMFNSKDEVDIVSTSSSSSSSRHDFTAPNCRGDATCIDPGRYITPLDDGDSPVYVNSAAATSRLQITTPSRSSSLKK
jgi:hypothetical protein